MNLKKCILNMALTACIVCSGGLEGLEVKSYKPAPFSLSSPLVKKSKKPKQLSFISAYSTDTWDTTMFGGFITFPVTTTKSGFSFPADNIYFTIPQTGSYMISLNLQDMSVTPPDSGDVFIMIMSDGQPVPGALLKLTGNEVIGSATIPARNLNRLLPLKKGQQIGVFVMPSDPGIVYTIHQTPAPYYSLSNRAIAIMQVK